MQEDFAFASSPQPDTETHSGNHSGHPISSSKLATTKINPQSTNNSGHNDDSKMTGNNIPSNNSDYPQQPTSQITALNNDNCLHSKNDATTTVSLTAKLNSYKYLDDYEYYRGERIKQNAMRRFSLIMQSIKAKYKDCPQSAVEEENDSDNLEDTSSEFSIFNQILRRHRKRFKQNPNLRHHR